MSIFFVITTLVCLPCYYVRLVSLSTHPIVKGRPKHGIRHHDMSNSQDVQTYASILESLFEKMNLPAGAVFIVMDGIGYFQ